VQKLSGSGVEVHQIWLPVLITDLSDYGNAEKHQQRYGFDTGGKFQVSKFKRCIIGSWVL